MKGTETHSQLIYITSILTKNVLYKRDSATVFIVFLLGTIIVVIVTVQKSPQLCYCVCFMGWLQVYYGLDLLLFKLSKAQVAESSVSGTRILIMSYANIDMHLYVCYVPIFFRF